MSAVANAVPADSRATTHTSIDDLDAAICRLASRINAVNYQLLVLVREFDDRMGWGKWSFPSCAEWLSWRCGISLSVAREKVRTAQALRDLPGISLAFREGRLSYTKVRALTRVAALHDEDTLLRYALDVTAPQATVKRLACDASLVVVTEDERGAPVSVSRKQRTVSAPIRRALWSRDRGCTFPGCHRTRFVDAHHVHHWAEGGETSVGNLVLLCSHHHRLLHEGGYRIRRDYQGEWYLVRADGRAIPRCGYHADDFADDDDDALENPSMEGTYATGLSRPNPSMEVRDGRGVYRLSSVCAELRA